MKFVISTQELNYLLNKIRNVVASKNALPILGNVLIEACNDEIVMTATDLTVAMRCVLEAKVLQEGGTALPAKLLAQLVGELKVPNLEIATNHHDVTELMAGSSRFKLHGMSKDEFPALPDVAESMRFTIKQSELKDMFFRTSFAVSREDNRFVLTGVFLYIENSIATLVGTDGKRLSRCQKLIQIDSSFKGGYIIPLKAVEEVAKNLGEEGDAIVSLMPDKVAIEASGTTIITKLLSGDYPDVNRVIPTAPAMVVTLHREELMSLLRQIALFTSDSSHSVRFTFANGELTLSANTMEIGEARVKMPVNYQGDKLEIAFNPSYLLDILRHCKKERVLIGLDDSYNPGVITDQEEPPLLTDALLPLYVLMPMRLSEE
jgi:DNA polymerase-3 subunit beta